MRTHHYAIRLLLTALLAGSTLSVVGCADKKIKKETNYPDDPDNIRKSRNGSLISEEGGFSLFGSGSKDDAQAAGAGGIPVNSFLWRGALDTLSFMPILSTDPFGGVIATDWYAPTTESTERFKLNVLILSATLRADGVRVTAFRQEKQPNGTWKDAPSNPKVAREFEDLILTRARELRVASEKK
ncbi:DUF3576 domain-containing protein [bacterium]|nr:DUF3576 domain-containing protein [bacterium]